MQTFLPYPLFHESAKVLDNRRLGKQRVECLQILNTLSGKSIGWANHPAVKMWRGHALILREYGLAICDTWIAKGFRDNCHQFIANSIYDFDRSEHSTPSWLGNPAFHASHRSNLLRKDPEWYGQFCWSEPHDLPYVWPTEELV